MGLPTIRPADTILAPRRKGLRRHTKVWQLYLIILIPFALVIVFNYVPMGGILIAFKDFNARQGILGSPWVGMKYFNQFFSTPIFWTILRNTVLLSLYSIAAGFPFPILLALAFNEMRHGRLKKTMQTVTYAPFFISTVVMVGIILQILSIRYGAINLVIKALGMAPIDFIGQGSMFRSIYVWSGIWQGAGYGSVLYIAALSSVDPTLYESAVIDGANRFQKVIHIDIPCILPTIVITLILSAGNILSVGFEKVFLLQNPLNYQYSEIISTYVYKIGIQQAQFSLSTAVGVFNSVINFAVLFLVNYIASKMNETSLF